MPVPPGITSLLIGLQQIHAAAVKRGFSLPDTWNVLSVLTLREVLRELARARSLPASALVEGRLFRSVPGFEADGRDGPRNELLAQLDLEALRGTAVVEASGPRVPWNELPVEAFGQFYESLLATRPTESRPLRKLTGSYYTPEALTNVVVQRAFAALEASRGQGFASAGLLRIVDPAIGAGAFLMQAGRALAERSGRPLADVVRSELFGVDVSPLAVAVAEASLWLLANDGGLQLRQAGANLREGDALCSRGAARTLGVCGIDWQGAEGLGNALGFDLVVGNPPWVAFAGRAAQPLSAEHRGYYRANFKAFRGYPTLHGLFVELSARLAPQGVVALLIPSPVADLDGYRHVRSCLAASHTVSEPLLELGQDAFESVTQPCFALIATPRRQAAAVEPERAFVLSERGRAAASASEVRVPPALARLASLPRLPAQLFGEMGLQTNGRVTRELLYRGSEPPADHSYALLEGRDVAEFRVRKPRLFLKPDREVLSACRCRLREASAYANVKLVVRQTAAITIAALHDGTPFRNSLLAGFELPEFPAELVLGLLNSQLYRALHLAARRDARQTTFPQVKIAHLRALPAPTRRSSACDDIARLAGEASRGGLTLPLRRALDAAVFQEFELDEVEAAQVMAFVRERSPNAGLVVPLSEST